jgi:hypothetical protein
VMKVKIYTEDQTTCLMIGESGFDSQQGKDLILLSVLFRAARGPMKPAIQWVLCAFSGGKAAGARN